MKAEICTRFQQCVRIWVASCDGTPAKKPESVRVTARAFMHWAVSLTARLFPISNEPRFPVLSVANRAVCHVPLVISSELDERHGQLGGQGSCERIGRRTRRTSRFF